MTKICNYQKPTELCFSSSEWEFIPNEIDFINNSLRLIESKFSSQNLLFRKAENTDIINLEKFIQYRYSCFSPEIAEEISKYDLYRFINFGHGLILEDSSSKILACLFEVGYNTPDKTSYTLRLGVDDILKGKNIGKLLIEYSSLLAMKNGSLTKRGLLDLTNFSSAVILLNKIGWICDGFYKDLTGLGTCFNIVFPLRMDSFYNNRIDDQKLQLFLKESKSEIDFKIVPYFDVESLDKIYSSEDFKIIYLLRGGLFTERNSFLAIPSDKLNITYCN